MSYAPSVKSTSEITPQVLGSSVAVDLFIKPRFGTLPAAPLLAPETWRQRHSAGVSHAAQRLHKHARHVPLMHIAPHAGIASGACYGGHAPTAPAAATPTRLHPSALPGSHTRGCAAPQQPLVSLRTRPTVSVSHRSLKPRLTCPPEPSLAPAWCRLQTHSADRAARRAYSLCERRRGSLK